MKNFSLKTLILILTISFIVSDELRFLDQVDSYPMYSGVVSHKSWKSGKIEKIFFFAIPFSFNCNIILDKTAKTITIDYPNYRNDLGNFKFVKEGSIKAESSVYNKFITFPENKKYNSMTLHLDLINNTDFKLKQVREYGNTKFRSLKVTVENVEKPYLTLDLTFDFNASVVSALQRKNIEDFIESFRTSSAEKKN